MLSEIQSHPTQIQPSFGLQRQQNPLPTDMPRRLFTPGQASNSTVQKRHATGGDWQEDVHKKSKGMEKLHFPELDEMYQNIALAAEDSYKSANVLSTISEVLEKDWILDSGCADRMSPDRQWFSSFTEIYGEKTVMANNMTCQIKGNGTIKIRMSDGVEITLTDVMYVPELKRNMISLGTLDAVGYTFKAFNGVLEVAKGALTVMKGTRRNGLYILRGTTILHVTTVASPVSQQLMFSQIESQPTQMQPPFGLDNNQIHYQQTCRRGSKQPVNLRESSPDSMAQSAPANGGDLQEEVYHKIEAMKEKYLPELNKMYQKILAKLQELESLQQPKSGQHGKLKLFKTMLERAIAFLQVPNTRIWPSYKEKSAHYEKQIANFIDTNKPRRPVSQLQQGQVPPSHIELRDE